jgi:hypothetical protein
VAIARLKERKKGREMEIEGEKGERDRPGNHY